MVISLIQRIEETFVAIPKPECTKRVARALDDEWFPSPKRVAELQLLDLEEDWRQVEPDDIRKFSNVLFWISPDGFRFYFTAFLRYAIANWKRSHDRVHLECMEVIGSQPSMIDSLTATEAKVLTEILVELSVDRGGEQPPCSVVRVARRFGRMTSRVDFLRDRIFTDFRCFRGHHFPFREGAIFVGVVARPAGLAACIRSAL